MKVTSAGRKEQPLARTPASVFVLTSEDIARSGLTSLPDVLRLVPGVQVARIDNHFWTVSLRGFTDDFSGYLLVLVDGRSIYNEAHSGVYWEDQEMLVDNIERIEVIRGPAGATWGANAVNGLINIITKPASETQGLRVVTGTGTQDPVYNGIRWGGKLGPNASYRLTSKYARRSPFADWVPPLGGMRDWSMAETGMRLDWQASERDSVLVSGDLLSGSSGSIILNKTLTAPQAPLSREDIGFHSGNLITRWQHSSKGVETQIQMYYDRLSHRDLAWPVNQNTVDFDFEQRRRWRARHDLVWGAGYRFVRLHTEPGTDRIDPPNEDVHEQSVFLQDEITVIPDRVTLTLGSRLERNGITGFQIQPTARVFWQTTRRLATWVAVSRAVHTPSLDVRSLTATEAAFQNPGGPLTELMLFGNADMPAASVLSYELGERFEGGSRWWVDLATYWNEYRNGTQIRSGRPYFAAAPVPHLVIPNFFESGAAARAYGAEIAAHWKATSWWRLTGGWSGIHLDAGDTTAGRTPRHQEQLTSNFNLPGATQLDVMLYHVSELPNVGVAARPQSLPGYFRGDVHLGWRATRHLMVEAGVQNATRREHVEFASWTGHLAEVPRNAYVRLTWMGE